MFKVVLISNLFQSLKTLNKSIQGNCENIIFTTTDKIKAFKEKLVLWKARIRRQNTSEMFDIMKMYKLNRNLIDLTLQSLTLLGTNIDKYFLD